IITAGTSALNVNASADNGFTPAEISDSEIKPTITLSKILLDEVPYNRTVKVQVMVDTEDYSYASTGLHIYYDPRLEIEENNSGNPKVKKGAAADMLMFQASYDATAEDYGMKGIFISTSGDCNAGISGVLTEITFNIPSDSSVGDVYPLDIVYRESIKMKDKFSTFNDNSTGKLMQAWTFTKGIYNDDTNYNFTADSEHIEKCSTLKYIDKSCDGYIAISDSLPVTTTITKPATTTTTTTKIPVTTTMTPSEITLAGDANCDGELSVADSTLILQYCGNKDKYTISRQGLINADADGTAGISPIDALIIQQTDAGIYKISDLPFKK
ncbi:MAG: hypothetical protein K2N49_07145, partial [Ruminococcus sp.]|nr:hypothetical protein [Ruminococcus sp.]